MSSTTPIHHHARTSRGRDQKETRRRLVDYALVILFFCMLLLAILAHLESRKAARSRISLANSFFVEQEKMRELLELAGVEKEDAKGGFRDPSPEQAQRRQSEGASHSDDPQNNAPLFVATTTTLGVTTENTDGDGLSPLPNPPYPTYEDVTTIRYENPRLGFVMELPTGWSVAYERGEEIVFSSGDYPYIPTLSEIKKKDGVLWLHVMRPCSKTEGASTLFHFSTSTGEVVREASSCVAPFLLTLGLRADVADSFAREEFLLNLGRTFYPMVSPVPPYGPIR